MRTLAVALLALSPGLWAQEVIPAGTVLPVRLSTSLDSRKCKAGQALIARLAQDVPLPQGDKIPARAEVRGHVISIAATPGGGARIALQFDTANFRKRSFSIATDLRAMASMMEVQEAQIPTTGVGHGDVWAWMDTNQIGGDAVYGEGGPVTHGSEVVGKAVPGGVLVQLRSRPGTTCRAGFEGNDGPQALWVFACDACGLYGFSNLELTHAGRSNPRGQIVLETRQGPLQVAAGSGLLLRVIAP